MKLAVRQLDLKRWSSRRVALLAAGVVGGWLASALPVSGADDASPSKESQEPPVAQPAKTLGSQSCARCHANELAVWKNTRHSQTFLNLHRQPRAKQIAQRMGLSSIKRSDVCIKCHYTQQINASGAPRATEGVSCELCHGAAKDWLTMHNDYGGPTATKQSESRDHAVQRYLNSVAAGMRNPKNPYMVARSCLNCHTVPDEKLVNVGGHVAGSIDFDLVRWSQGMLRHNFLKGKGANVASSPQRLRVMHVVGAMADLEYSLRATAVATKRQPYALTSAKRAAERRQQLVEIYERTQHPLVLQALEASYSAGLKLDNRKALLEAADAIGNAAYQLGESDGADLAAIDDLAPPASEYRYQSRRP